jgi:hypothetical protein
MATCKNKAWVWVKVSNALQAYTNGNTTIKINDQDYYLPSVDDFNDCLAKWRDEKLPILQPSAGAECRDCDNFAREFKAFADRYACDVMRLDHEWCVGQAWGHFSWTGCEREYHVCNWVILDDEYFWWIEPQYSDDMTYEAGESDSSQPLRFIML